MASAPRREANDGFGDGRLLLSHDKQDTGFEDPSNLIHYFLWQKRLHFLTNLALTDLIDNKNKVLQS